jgi:hypothetical protein
VRNSCYPNYETGRVSFLCGGELIEKSVGDLDVPGHYTRGRDDCLSASLPVCNPLCSGAVMFLYEDEDI